GSPSLLARKRRRAPEHLDPGARGRPGARSAPRRRDAATHPAEAAPSPRRTDRHSRPLPQPPRSWARSKAERDGFRHVWVARAPGTPAISFTMYELFAGLFPVAECVVGAERDLVAARQQKPLTALHEVFLVEGPGIHEVLQHDHEHAPGDVGQVRC